MSKPYEIHVISNTHWDREWLCNFQETRMMLVEFFDRLLDSLLDASRRVLADRSAFVLSIEQAVEWDRINETPARELPGLLRLMERTSPFTS